MVKPLPDQTPLAEVLRSLKDATRGKDGKGSPLKLYVDPTSLQESEITMETPIAAPLVGQDEVSLHTYLGLNGTRIAQRLLSESFASAISC